jgi:hypothetical protein
MFKRFKSRGEKPGDSAVNDKLKLRDRKVESSRISNPADSVLQREMDRRDRRRKVLRRPGRRPLVLLALVVIAVLVSLFVHEYEAITDLSLSRKGLDAITILKRNADNESALAELKSVAADLLRRDRAGNHVHEAVLAVYTIGSLAAGHEPTFVRGRKFFTAMFPDSAYGAFLSDDKVARACVLCGRDGTTERPCGPCAADGSCPFCGGTGKRESLAKSGRSERCTGCDGDRKCAKCGGTGQIRAKCRECNGTALKPSSASAREALVKAATRAQWTLRGELILGHANNVLGRAQRLMRRK